MNRVIVLLSFGVFFSIPSSSLAETKSQDSQEITLPDFSDLQGYTKKTTFKPSVKCKTSSGRMIKSGQAGYEDCLREAQTFTKSKGHNNEVIESRPSVAIEL